MTLHYVNGGVMKKNPNNHFDAYFTKPEIAKMLFKKTKKICPIFNNIIHKINHFATPNY